MILPKEIRQEAARYAKDDNARLEAFIAGAMFARTGKYYQEQNFSDDLASFERWWLLYDKKRGKKKAQQKWLRLTPSQREACIAATPAYVKSIQDKQFQKDPLTYLNGECWNDEIIQQQDNEQQRSLRLASKAARILGNNGQG